MFSFKLKIHAWRYKVVLSTPGNVQRSFNLAIANVVSPAVTNYNIVDFHSFTSFLKVCLVYFIGYLGTEWVFEFFVNLHCTHN